HVPEEGSRHPPPPAILAPRRRFPGDRSRAMLEGMAPLVIAHRGDSAHRPENTMASFASALEVGADLVELDVQLTRDGAVVVIHDATLERTTSGRGDVREMALREVRAVSAGFPSRFGAAYAGERVPVLAEVLGL